MKPPISILHPDEVLLYRKVGITDAFVRSLEQELWRVMQESFHLNRLEGIADVDELYVLQHMYHWLPTTPAVQAVVVPYMGQALLTFRDLLLERELGPQESEERRTLRDIDNLAAHYAKNSPS